MFGTKNIYAMVNGFKVRVKDAREKDRNHQVEIDLEVPLTYRLADEILPAMARDLFEEVNGEWHPKPELDEASFNLSPDTQLVEIREHPELDPIVRIVGVTIRRITAYKGEANALLLGFTATWTLKDYEKEAVAMIRRLKTGVYMTCEAQQINMLDTSVPASQQGTDVSVEKGGTVTSIRSRGRKKDTPATAPVGEEVAAGG